MTTVRRPRDNQRARLYRAEQNVRYLHDVSLITSGEDPAIMLAKAQRFVDRVLNRKYVRSHYNANQIHVTLSDGAAHRWAHAFENWGRIQLPRNGHWAFSEMVLLHEIAHIFVYRRNNYSYTAPGHGWEFAAIFIDLVRNVMGADAADALKRSYRENRVRFTEKRTRNLSPEARAAAAIRIAKARAAKVERMKLIKKFDQQIGIYSPPFSGAPYQIGGDSDWKIETYKDPFRMSLRELHALEKEYRLKQMERHDPFQVDKREPWYDYAMANMPSPKPPIFATITGIV